MKRPPREPPGYARRHRSRLAACAACPGVGAPCKLAAPMALKRVEIAGFKSIREMDLEAFEGDGLFFEKAVDPNKPVERFVIPGT